MYQLQFRFMYVVRAISITISSSFIDIEHLEHERRKQEHMEREMQRRIQEKIDREKKEQERQEKLEREKRRKEKERLERERLEQERLERERLERERIERERQERIERERQERIGNYETFFTIIRSKYTVWKFQDFGITEILCEVNFVASRSGNTAVFAILWALKFNDLSNFCLQKVQKFIKI